MPFEVKLRNDVQFIHPLKRNYPRAISRLTLQFIEVLGSKFCLVFSINSNVTKEELCDYM